MLLNYLKLSLRLLARNPFFTFINVLGLAVGFAVFFMLWQYSWNELKSDQFHVGYNRIGRLGMTMSFQEDSVTRILVTFGAPRTYHPTMIASDFQQVESYTRIMHQPTFNLDLVGHDSEVVVGVSRKDGAMDLFKESRMAYVDPNLFEFFSIPLIQGSKESVLSRANTIAISQTIARKYFGTKDPVGEVLVINNTVLLTVTGVFQDLPHNSHLVFDMVVSNVGIEHAWRDHRYYPIATSYLKLTRADQMENFEGEIHKIQGKYLAQDLHVRPFARFNLFFQPLSEIPFSTPYARDYLQPKSKSTLILLQTASVLILLMAWVNYLNLSVSRSLKRLKEVATRKMSGALSLDFFKQFLVESSLVHFLAIGLALTLIQLVRFPAQLFLDIQIPEISSVPRASWLTYGLVITSGILVTGLYPALMSAAYNPRSLFMISGKGARKRLWQSILTTGQYAVALILMLWAFIVYLQLNYILNKDIGYDRQHVIVIDAPTIRADSHQKDFESFMTRVRSTEGVREATYSLFVNGDFYGLRIFGLQPRHGNFFQGAYDGGVDETFIPFYKISLAAGRNFVPHDLENAMIVSRHAAKRLGYVNVQDAIGQNIAVEGGTIMQVVGVIEDYRYNHMINVDGSETEANTGAGITLTYQFGKFGNDLPRRISVRVDMNQLDETLIKIGKHYSHAFPGNAFNWYFLEDYSNRVYRNEKINRNQIILFTVLAIGISCLGLLGMMAAQAEEKIKEIGIRKVLGAGVRNIGVGLLTRSIRHFIVAIVIAMPVAYYLANEYLMHYLERIHLQWWHFALPVMILISIMLSTVASVLWKAASNNPVDALKHE